MTLLPVLVLALLLLLWLRNGYVYYIIPLLAVDLLVFGALGFAETFTGKGASNRLLYEKVGKDKTAKNEKEIVLEIDRFYSSEKSIKTKQYVVGTDKFTTVLDALIKIKQEQDGSLAVRYSCRMGICGSCGVVINGKPGLACEANAGACEKDGKVKVGPMLAHPLVKDLVNDFDDFFEKHIAVNPGIERQDSRDKFSSDKPYRQKQGDIDKFLPYSYCIMCGLCLEACPVVNTNSEFIGPQALSQAYRYLKDSKDQDGGGRIRAIDKLTGLWGCEYAGACSEACPKGVDPATAIQLLKAESAKSFFNSEKDDSNED